MAPDRRLIQVNPIYSGVNGQPISFSVVNEQIATTNPGPYQLSLYTDNPVIVLKASQQGTPGEVSFNYNWLFACSGPNNPPTVANPISPQSATVNQSFSFVIPTNIFTDAETPSSLTFTVSGLPAGLSFVSPTTITGTPSTTVGSPFSVTARAIDPGGLSAYAIFQLSVSPTTGNCSNMVSVKVGNWNDATVWSCSRVPISSDVVTLNHAVTLPGSYQGQALRVRYNSGGRLLFSIGGRLRLAGI
ncbi:hypothetical protein IC229_30905 [Spirosoma sp. BT702]|uniref:Dystroglycan-type cadherin-like domain-containing protein n=1 Tax=Spirosoma profusum TaxID=2771354 RepID=A0A927AVD0_9BACT|nr:putative Ig domain-containing protein [Spirosoma profusum]MBD2705076.1 hypothetical protein [Spirosoma profusum]